MPDLYNQTTRELLYSGQNEKCEPEEFRHSDKPVNQAASNQRIIVKLKSRVTDGGLYTKKKNDNKYLKSRFPKGILMNTLAFPE